MNIIVADDYDDLSHRAANWILEQSGKDDAPLAVFPTGNTPKGTYRELLSRANVGTADLAKCRYASLDEYAGIAPDDPRSLVAWLQREFLDPVGISTDRVITFNSQALNPEEECQRIEDAIGAAGGIDILVLGLGPNGHLGFNEPPSAFESRTRMVDLAEKSLESNAAYWDGAEVPKQAYTLGLGTLREAKHTLLLVSGAHKAEILTRTLDGPITPDVPSTVLRIMSDVTLIADQDALGSSSSLG